MIGDDEDDTKVPKETAATSVSTRSASGPSSSTTRSAAARHQESSARKSTSSTKSTTSTKSERQKLETVTPKSKVRALQYSKKCRNFVRILQMVLKCSMLDRFSSRQDQKPRRFHCTGRSECLFWTSDFEKWKEHVGNCHSPVKEDGSLSRGKGASSDSTKNISRASHGVRVKVSN